MKNAIAAIALFGPCAAGLVGAHSDGGGRKSMSFMPNVVPSFDVPFQTVPPRRIPQNMSIERDPFTLALDHCASVVSPYPRSASLSQYFVRNDSYTDRNTGITHVYIRQVVSGLEVFNAGLNVNVKDGRVLLHGYSVSSFAPIHKRGVDLILCPALFRQRLPAPLKRGHPARSLRDAQATAEGRREQAS